MNEIQNHKTMKNFNKISKIEVISQRNSFLINQIIADTQQDQKILTTTNQSSIS